MPTTAKGKWILDKREEMEPEHINLIRNLYAKLIEYKQKPLTDHTLRMIKEYQRDLDYARTYQPPKIKNSHKKREYTVFYGEYDVFDNLEVLGEDFIWQMYRDSPDLIWKTAFLNMRLDRVENCFYSALNESVHFYEPADPGKLQAFGSDWDKLQSCGCLADGDIDYDRPLHIAFDANAAICSAVVGQVDEQNKIMRVLKSFYVKTPGKLQDLVKLIADYYRPKLSHEVIVYYDHTFTWASGTSNDSYSDVINKVLMDNGYHVNMVFVGQAPRHDWKHNNIDRTLKGDPAFLAIKINLYNNEFLKIAMEQTGVRQGKNGFEKDKRAENLPDSPNNPDEYKTHITDAFDTLWYGCNFFFDEAMAAGGSGIVFLGSR